MLYSPRDIANQVADITRELPAFEAVQYYDELMDALGEDMYAAEMRDEDPDAEVWEALDE